MKKNYEVTDYMLIDEEENVVLVPGDIVEIEFDDVPNDWPCLILNDEMYDIAFDSMDEFNYYFKEVNLKESEAIEFVSKDINVIHGPSLIYDNVDTTIEVVEMRLNTGEYLIVLAGVYDSDKKPASPDNIDFWRVSSKSIIDEFKDIEYNEVITWPDSEYFDISKADYSKVVESELEKYLVLYDEEGWG